jgi:hypothetical protein
MLGADREVEVKVRLTETLGFEDHIPECFKKGTRRARAIIKQ